MRMHMIGNIGDEIAMTAVIREYKRENPEEMVRIHRPKFSVIYDNNPHINHGRLENGERKILIPFHDDAPNIPASLGRQLGVEMKSTQPEVFLSDEERKYASEILKDVPRPIAVIDTRASHLARVWPKQRFQVLVGHLRADGWSIVEMGSDPEDGFPYNPGRLSPLRRTTMSLLNKTTLREAFAILDAADLYIGNDSGLSHAAAAVNTPSVVIFSVSPPQVRAYDTTVPVWCGEPCPPQCRFYCARKNAKEDWCMLKIDPEAVMEAVAEAREKFGIERRKV